MRRTAMRLLTVLALLLPGGLLASCDLGQSTGNGYQHVSNSIP